MLNAGTSADIIREAHQIYVFKRLPHHLVPYGFKDGIKDSFMLRFALLTVMWIVFCRNLGSGRRQQMFNAFVWGVLGIAAAGLIFAYGLVGNRELSAEILRFYWFRLSDIVVPMGVAFGSVRFCIHYQKEIQSVLVPSFPKVLVMTAIIAAIYFAATYYCFGFFKLTPDANVPWAITLLICFGLFHGLPKSFVIPSATIIFFYLAIAVYAPLTISPKYVDLRTYSGQCRSEPTGPAGKKATKEWQDMCQWIKENTPKTAKFWIPRDGQTFKWHAYRSDIGTWKNIPQDADSIVKWWTSLEELYKGKTAEGVEIEDRLITALLLVKTEKEIAELQRRYGFEYIVCAQGQEMPKHPLLQREYSNAVYCLYRVCPP
jgi:hypothetical protein